MPYPQRKPYTPYPAYKPRAASKPDGYGSWMEKDFWYEYGISLGAAIGWAIQTGPGMDGPEIEKRARALLTLGLRMKSDPRLIEEFKAYFTEKKHLLYPEAPKNPSLPFTSTGEVARDPETGEEIVDIGS